MAHINGILYHKCVVYVAVREALLGYYVRISVLWLKLAHIIGAALVLLGALNRVGTMDKGVL